MTGYQWLYKGKAVQHCNVTGRYSELRKEGWSVFLDGRDLNESPTVEVIQPKIEEKKDEFDQEQPGFVCDVCGKTYKLKMHLATHRRKHKG